MPKPDIGTLTDEDCRELLAELLNEMPEEAIIEVLTKNISHTAALQVADAIYDLPDG